MDDLDLDLRPPGDEPQPPPATGRSRAPWVALAALILVVLGGAAAYFLTRPPSAAPASAAQPEAPPAASPPSEIPPLGGEPEPVDVPPLDESDPVVRMLAQMLSANPTFLSWLASDDLIRSFTATVVKVAGGQSPSSHLRMMRPTAGFAVRRHGGDVSMDARSYTRYAPIVTAISSVDAAAAARVYSTLKPRIDDAYRELGYTDSFDRTLERAIVLLLMTPVPKEPIRLQRGEATEYLFADPALERLTSAQKHLLRLGPAQMRAVQASLRNVAAALGIPPGRLPPVP